MRSMRRLFVTLRVRNGDGSERVMFDDFAPFVPPQFGIKLASEPWELADSARLREAVFCREQRIFERSDADAIDDVATTVVAVDYLMGMMNRVVGTVRIHAETADTWYGSRLAIDAAYRNIYGLGSGLIFRAVTTAHARGCRTFLANVQQANVEFFRRLAWEPIRSIEIANLPHTLMRADLSAYPPSADDAFVSTLRRRRAS
jgi:putative N-acetyltransferase (TIGR04045 family)